MKSQHRFYINISRENYLKYYAGQASSIQVQSEEGLTLQFPATTVKPWITHQGIQGHFIIIFDENNKLIEMKKVR